MGEVVESIYAEGQDAFERGESEAACPYWFWSSQRRLWLDGWDEARRFAEQPVVVFREPPPAEPEEEDEADLVFSEAAARPARDRLRSLPPAPPDRRPHPEDERPDRG